MSEPAGAKTKKIEPPKDLAEAKAQEIALVSDYLELEQIREDLKGEIEKISRKMGDIKYMVYGTRKTMEVMRAQIKPE